MKVLSIESTCDETAAALVESFDGGARVIKNIVASSSEMHKKYGGIVPEVAAREQVRSIVPVISEALGNEAVDAVAVSYGPGLMGSLLIGVETAKVLAWAWKKPLLKVNHLAAHVLANWIVEEKIGEIKVPEFPAVGLVASGGHTDLILLTSITNWTWIGGTRDDAAGEAYDKAARLLGLPYPGGPEMDKAANKITEAEWLKYKSLFNLPRPLIHDPRLDMSFSGIKAAIARAVESKEYTDFIPDQTKSEIENNDLKISILAKEFSEAVVEVLVKKTMRAVQQYKPKSVLLAGGVAANKKLRESLRSESESLGVSFFVPEFKYCGDNAAMVGAAAVLRPEESELSLKPDPSLGVV